MSGDPTEKTMHAGLLGKITEFFRDPGHLCTFFVLVCFGLGVMGAVGNRGKESPWIVVLFAIPFSMQVYALHYFFKCLERQYKGDNGAKAFLKLYVWVMGSFLCILYLLWSSYVYDWVTDYTSMSYVALALIVVSLVPVWFTTFALMRPERGEHTKLLKDLRLYALQMPVLSILFSFTLFIGISYLFSFSLAFHNRSRPPGNPALFMPEWYASDGSEPDPKRDPPGAGSSSQGPPLNPNSGTTLPSVFSESGSEYRFYFEKGRAHLEVNGDRDSREGPEAYYRREVNLFSLNRIKTDIEKEEKGARILARGGADGEGFKTGETYSSNYELSEARAISVRVRIQDSLTGRDWRYIEWETVPASSEMESPQPSTEAEKQMKPEDLRRVVIVSIFPVSGDPSFQQRENHKAVGRWVGELRDEIRNSHTQPTWQHPKPGRLKLIEYVYFTIYTITTTGYGDIVPITGYSKFLVSFANLCEVFFLVVFFNALISSSKGESDPAMPPDPRGADDPS